MLSINALVVYKNRPALIIETGEKIRILTGEGEDVKVRPKDIDVLHGGPAKLEDTAREPEGDIRSAWELLLGSDTAFGLKELAELAWGAYTPQTAWAAYRALQDGLYFCGETRAIRPRTAEEYGAELRKREEKQREAGERERVLALLAESLKQNRPLDADGAAAAQKYLGDAEALAEGRTNKSRTLKELGLGETPEAAHELLLATGVWTVFKNPHPGRFGVPLCQAVVVPGPPGEEERVDLSALPAFAIDSPWSSDPDDAVFMDGKVLWVHVADPAAAVGPQSPAEEEARGRGATLYLPEGTYRMLAPEVLFRFALGLEEKSPALSFKITLNDDLSVAQTEIVRSWVRVQRLSYEEADRIAAAGSADPAEPALAALFRWAEKNEERRLNSGAVLIDFPEVHITVQEGLAEGPAPAVQIEPIPVYRSAAVVRECMVLAGEAAAKWALENRLPFPYAGQEEGAEFPKELLGGLAGAYQIRRLMRPRNLSTKPQVHWGLGLDQYTQVTSPLRRYTDLAAHQQIRALLRGEPPLSEEELALRLRCAEEAALAVSRAEKASRAHWTTVYLMDKIGSAWEGTVMDKKSGSSWAVYIPALGLESTVNLRGKAEPNEKVPLKLARVRLYDLQMNFVHDA